MLHSNKQYNSKIPPKPALRAGFFNVKNMKKTKEFVNFLSGKKTYIVGCLIIIYGIVYQDQAKVLEGLSIITLRAGIAKK